MNKNLPQEIKKLNRENKRLKVMSIVFLALNIILVSSYFFAQSEEYKMYKSTIIQ